MKVDVVMVYEFVPGSFVMYSCPLTVAALCFVKVCKGCSNHHSLPCNTLMAGKYVVEEEEEEEERNKQYINKRTLGQEIFLVCCDLTCARAFIVVIE